MNYEVRLQTNANRIAGPFAVLDTAIHEARKASTHKTLGPFHVYVAEVGAYGASRVRAFAFAGRLEWAVECKACAAACARASRPDDYPYCSACQCLRAVPDRR